MIGAAFCFLGDTRKLSHCFEFAQAAALVKISLKTKTSSSAFKTFEVGFQIRSALVHQKFASSVHFNTVPDKLLLLDTFMQKR